MDAQTDVLLKQDGSVLLVSRVTVASVGMVKLCLYLTGLLQERFATMEQTMVLAVLLVV